MEENAKQQKSVLKIVGNVLIGIFFLFAVCMLIIAFASQSNEHGVPVIGKKVVLSVLSGSMEPVFKQGDMLIGEVLSDEEKEQLEVGNIISFKMDLNGDGVKEINTHRIVSITAGVIRTRGDNPEYNHGAVDDGRDIFLNDVICIWDEETGTKIPVLGGFISFLQGQLGFFLLIVLPLLALFIYELVHFIIVVKQVTNKGKKVITAEDEAHIREQAVLEYIKQHGGVIPAEGSENNVGNADDVPVETAQNDKEDSLGQ